MNDEQPRRTAAGTLDRDCVRLEFFSDAVFAFVATLLVVSLEVPTEFHELTDRLAAFPGFAIGFTVLLLFWARHRAFFKRFGHYDVPLVIANGAVLFALLFFVFPLKWTVNLVLARMLGLDIGSAGALELRTYADLTRLFVLFSTGFAAVFAAFFLLHVAAWRHRAELAPAASERARLAFELRQNAFAVVLAAASIGFTLGGIGLTIGFPLWLLLALVPLRAIHRRLSPAMSG
jgi:uncharacterized membrane protein